MRDSSEIKLFKDHVGMHNFIGITKIPSFSKKEESPSVIYLTEQSYERGLLTAIKWVESLDISKTEDLLKKIYDRVLEEERTFGVSPLSKELDIIRFLFTNYIKYEKEVKHELEAHGTVLGLGYVVSLGFLAGLYWLLRKV